MTVEEHDFHRENTDCALSRAILASLFSHPHIHPKGCLLSGAMLFACNLGVAALSISQRGLAIPESLDTAML